MRRSTLLILALIVMVVMPVFADRQPTSTPTPPDMDTIFIPDVQGCTGDTIVVEVRMANPETEVDAFLMTVFYEAEMLTYLSCSAGDLDPGWEMFDCFEPSPGHVNMGGFSIPPVAVPTNSNGVLVEMLFEVTCFDCDQGDASALIATNLYDDIVGFSPFDGVFTFVCPTPTPIPTETPTPTPTDTPSPTPTEPLPIPATGPIGTGLLLALLGVLMFNPAFRKR